MSLYDNMTVEERERMLFDVLIENAKLRRELAQSQHDREFWAAEFLNYKKIVEGNNGQSV